MNSDLELRQGLRALERADAAHTPDRVRAALIAGLRAGRRRSRIWFAIPLAAAAALTFWMFRPRPVAEIPQPVVSVAPAPEPITAETPEPVVLARQRVLPARRVAVKPPLPREVRTEFYPVNSAGYAAPLEHGVIVRVQLPRIALLKMGIAVSGDRLNASVPAEVLLGEDGLVRAVRFVSNVQ